MVGGFLITDRMLKMFRQRLPGGAGGAAPAAVPSGGNGARPDGKGH